MSIDGKRGPLGRVLARLRADRKAGTAIVFALATPVMVGGLALGVDFSMYHMIRNRMQIAVDGAALAAAMEIEQRGNVAGRAVSFINTSMPSQYSGMTNGSDVQMGTYDQVNGFRPSNHIDANAVRVTAERSLTRGNAARQIFSGLFGQDLKTITVAAIAARPVNVWYQPPESDTLDPEAGDFNEMYAYCYDTTGGGPAESRRTQMTLIANNMPAGQNIVAISGGRVTANPQRPSPWPRCTERGQTLSFRLRNIRHVKSNPVLWANPNARIENRNPGRPEFNYFTDTTLNNGVERFDNQLPNILETVRCDTAAECRPGARVPTGRNRANTRVREATPCQPGKFMYFGFEDRPPGRQGANASWLDPAWTDTDYDDIRIVMRCPNSGRLGDAFVRLVG